MSASHLCQCWKIERRDGQIFGFTDHDEDIDFEQTIFRAREGLTPSEAKATIGFDVDDLEVQGGFSSDSISEAAIERGEFDGANVWQYRVDWKAPGTGWLENRYILGEIARTRNGYVMEMRSRVALLSRARGRHLSNSCDAELGDTRCGVDLNGVDQQGCALTQTVIVEEVKTGGRVSVNAISDPSGTAFTGGLLRWNSADYTGYSARIQRQNGGELHLMSALPFPETGSLCNLSAGCDKSFDTCHKRFANAENFRGFPSVPSVIALAPEFVRNGEAKPQKRGK